MNTRIKYLFLSLILALILIASAIFSFPDNKLHLIFCDVGQGDAILITYNQTQILVDGGPNQKILGCLSKHMPFWDKDLELIVSTHPEADHLTGLVSVLERYNVRQISTNSFPDESGVFSKFRQEVIEKKIPVFSPKTGDQIKIGPIKLKTLFPLQKLGDEVVWKNPADIKVLGLNNFSGNFNDTAIVSQLSFGKFQALLTGDIGINQENDINSELGPVDVLKVAHHGSKSSSSEAFLEKIAPKLAVISVGIGNRYGHPTNEVLERLRNLNIKILRTDTDGEVEVVSDGESWGVK
ncbi:MAG: MBL fold metallo-hydrolase [bacterium]|nr:MBL fold metallo-hydrolase [bacterium]